MKVFRNKIALIIVASWVAGIFACLVLAALDSEPDRWIGYMKEFSAITGPIVGAIAGFYFREDRRQPSDDGTQEDAGGDGE